MAVKNIDTTGWEAVEWLDANPGAGAYLGERKDMDINGRTVQATSGLHAVYIWAMQVCGESGHQELCRCAHCGVGIRYIVIFRDAAGNHHPVGQDCADYIQSFWNRAEWMERQMLRKIKKFSTSNGERYALTLKVDVGYAWFWDIEKRPSFVSTSKYRAPGKHADTWYLTVWGADAGEIIRNLEALRALKPAALAARAAKDETAKAIAAQDISYAERCRIAREAAKKDLKASVASQ